MSPSQNKVPLGAVLQQAGLVSADDIKEALKQQRQESKNRRIGEILASKGCIKSQTADFFVENWSVLIEEKRYQPIGQYFKQAALLDDEQIQTILDRQKQSKLKFGEIAIARGWLKQTTVDFFLRYIMPQPPRQSEEAITQQTQHSNSVDFTRSRQESFYKIKLKLLNLEDRETYSEKVLEKVLFWTGGQSFLTQKLFELIEEKRDLVVSGKEAEQVDYLVQTTFLKNWREAVVGTHLQAIEERVLNNQQTEPTRLLQLYQKILTTEVMFDRSLQQRELLKTGLVVKQQEQLVVANRIYQLVFNPSWVHNTITKLSHRDNSAVAIISSNTEAIVPNSPQTAKQSLSLKNLLLLLALLALILVFFDNISKKLKVRTAFKQGNQFLKQKSFSEAISQYNQLLNIDSNYFQAWTNRGYALAGLQQYNEMRESCSTATIIDPTAVYAWNCQGEALHNLQRAEEAIFAFDKAIALDKTDPIFLINKSESLEAIGKEEESLVTISQAIEVLEQIEAIKGKERVKGEFAVALTFLGNGYRKKEQYETAISNYDRALEYSPNYFPARIGKGIVLKRLKRNQQAQREFESILTNKQLSTTKQAQTWFYLGQTLCEAQSLSSGINAFDRAIKLVPDYKAAQQARQNCN